MARVTCHSLLARAQFISQEQWPTAIACTRICCGPHLSLPPTSGEAGTGSCSPSFWLLPVGTTRSLVDLPSPDKELEKTVETTLRHSTWWVAPPLEPRKGLPSHAGPSVSKDPLQCWGDGSVKHLLLKPKDPSSISSAHLVTGRGLPTPANHCMVTVWQSGKPPGHEVMAVWGREELNPLLLLHPAGHKVAP